MSRLATHPLPQEVLEKERQERRARDARHRLVEERLKRQLAEAQVRGDGFGPKQVAEEGVHDNHMVPGGQLPIPSPSRIGVPAWRK